MSSVCLAHFGNCKEASGAEVGEGTEEMTAENVRRPGQRSARLFLERSGSKPLPGFVAKLCCNYSHFCYCGSNAPEIIHKQVWLGFTPPPPPHTQPNLLTKTEVVSHIWSAGPIAGQGKHFGFYLG